MRMSLKVSEELDKVEEGTSISIQEAMNKFEKIHEKIRFQVFGKVSIHKEKNKRPIIETIDDKEHAKIIF